jgi:endonuclease/exonuclease/phosphatase family metal-dependent hydrolase
MAPAEASPLPAPALRVVTFNVRYDDARRGSSARERHRRTVSATLQSLDADILCLQEVITLQGRTVLGRNRLRESLERDLQGWSGWLPEGASALAEASPIFIRSRRFGILDGGIFWFSDTPDVPDSRSWGNALPRFCSWLLLEDRPGGARLCVANVHLDHRSGASRLKAAELLLRRLPQLAAGVPMLVAGDFNAGRRSRVQHALSGRFRRVTGDSTPSLRFPLPRQIDQIFISPQIRLRESRVAGIEGRGGLCGTTDHRPVVADLQLPRSEECGETGEE